MTPSAKPWTHSRMSFWSWLSSREKGVSSSCVDEVDVFDGVDLGGSHIADERYTMWRHVASRSMRAMALDTASAELTIDELARETGMTVRNIRSHATRGLLQPPEVRARTGYYGPDHVARLRLIQELQSNGYNLAAVKHLIERGDGSGRAGPRVRADAADAVRAPSRPRSSTRPSWRRSGGRRSPIRSSSRRAEKLGLVAPLGDGRYEILSPTVLRAGEVVRELGVPPEQALDIVERVREGGRRGEQGVRRSSSWSRCGAVPRRAAATSAQVQEAVEQLRPLATETLVAVFHLRMTQAVEQRLRARAGEAGEGMSVRAALLVALAALLVGGCSGGRRDRDVRAVLPGAAGHDARGVLQPLHGVPAAHARACVDAQGGGQRPHRRVGRTARYVVRDAGAPLEAGAGCTTRERRRRCAARAALR